VAARYLVDPELQAVLDFMPFTAMNLERLPETRALLAEMTNQRNKTLDTDGVNTEVRWIPGPQGAPAVRVVIYSPPKGEMLMPGYLHIHGGGYVVGEADMAATRAHDYVRRIGCTVLSVDYRLAPETSHPGPVEDCYAALEWFHHNAVSLGVDPARIAIGGESAGGGLAAAVGLLARDRGKLPICFQLLSYPMLDDRTAVLRDPHPLTGEFVWSAASNSFGWQSLLGQEPGSPDVSPYAAVARADDLAGLPPTFVGVGALDLFLEEDMEFARRLTRSGVATELHVYPGAYHGFEMTVEEAAVSIRYRRDMLQALERAFLPARLVADLPG
jgi:acetyl esterase/lipase